MCSGIFSPSLAGILCVKTALGPFLTLDRETNIGAQANTKKDISTDDENYHGTQHNKPFFYYLAVLISISYKITLPKPSIWSKMVISIF